MTKSSSTPSSSFLELVEKINGIGRKRHEDDIFENARHNVAYATRSVKQLPALAESKLGSAVVISGGPSVIQRKSIERLAASGYQGTLIAADASYISCLRRGVIPDYVITLDPHPTRIVRWFGDPNWEAHNAKDDYFERQDINVEFRKNSIRQNQENIELINKLGHKTKAIVATTAPDNVVERILEAKFDVYWWNPLVDDPREPTSITRRLYELNKLPCVNTGGNVGTASWAFASQILKIKRIGLLGMDLGYYDTTPYKQTQTYYELASYHGGEEGLEKFFTNFEFPLTGERYYTDPTYFWYRKNLLELLGRAQGINTFNCTEGGTLYGENVKCVRLEDFLNG